MKSCFVSLMFLLLTTFTAAQQSASVLIIQSTPGGAQVYVDDELRGTTSQQGRLKISTLKPGKHVLRVSLSDYDDWQGSIVLKQGQPLTKSLALSQTAATAQSSGSGPSLDETLFFIQSTLESDSGSTTTFTNNSRVARNRSSLVRRGTGCTVVATTTTTWNPKEVADQVFSYTIDLALIDPASVSATAMRSAFENMMVDGFQVQLTTTNNTLSVERSDNGQLSKASAFVVELSDQQAAQRVAKAFSHAVTLCGGKPSSF